MADPARDRVNLLLERRSIRRYQLQPVQDDKVEALLQAAMAAPSAVARDPWRFIVLRDATLRSQVAAGLPNGKFLARAPLGIVVCGDPSAAHDQQESYLLQDCSAAIENILLAAHLLGLGACWLGVHPRAQRMALVRQVLGIPESILPVAVIAIGYPAETKAARTRYDVAKVHHEGW